MTTNLTHLAKLTSVEDGYRHYPKEVVALPDHDVVLPDSHLKWYEVRKAEATVDPAVRTQGEEFLRAEVASGDLAISGELGFVVHHLCGESFHFLIVCTWRNNNEMWLTVYYREVTQHESFQRLEQGTHLQVICVWEMGAVLHERQAWSRFLYSDRDDEAKAAYLADRFNGTV
ncbi:hypothetical protein FHS29_004761 [Saccharothrix tamanrassetensis]|uniref:Uncharacterized protein n=1 Tax=Saccharothrix tamanrassetensis TaxID=1051531 RepID=A0A841CMJ8_9PSEU|nr:hypothetical protein [Saccharothrix tamanrassetensis]MBB5958153.1 hypothetical protein [Saccharothrix tamanrassetensis]